MNRAQLEHAIRAAGAICGDRELYVVESQAILAAFPDAPADLVLSMEVDISPKNRPELEELVEGSIGELSLFHQTFGFYVDGVDLAAVALPEGWRERVVIVDNANTNGFRGLCLSPADLAASKLAAGREKDIAFVRGMLREGLVTLGSLRESVAQIPGLLPERGEWIARLLDGLAAGPA